MKVVFTKHAQKKFKFLKELGWNINPKIIKEGLNNPISIHHSYSETKTALYSINKTHNLRIVYVKENGIITVITFYPVAKGRYDKKQSSLRKGR